MSEQTTEAEGVLTEGQLCAIRWHRTSVSNRILERDRELSVLRDELVALDRAIKLLEAAQ